MSIIGFTGTGITFKGVVLSIYKKGDKTYHLSAEDTMEKSRYVFYVLMDATSLIVNDPDFVDISEEGVIRIPCRMKEQPNPPNVPFALMKGNEDRFYISYMHHSIIPVSVYRHGIVKVNDTVLVKNHTTYRSKYGTVNASPKIYINSNASYIDVLESGSIIQRLRLEQNLWRYLDMIRKTTLYESICFDLPGDHINTVFLLPLHKSNPDDLFVDKLFVTEVGINFCADHYDPLKRTVQVSHLGWAVYPPNDNNDLTPIKSILEITSTFSYDTDWWDASGNENNNELTELFLDNNYNDFRGVIMCQSSANIADDFPSNTSTTGRNFYPLSEKKQQKLYGLTVATNIGELIPRLGIPVTREFINILCEINYFGPYRSGKQTHTLLPGDNIKSVFYLNEKTDQQIKRITEKLSDFYVLIKRELVDFVIKYITNNNAQDVFELNGENQRVFKRGLSNSYQDIVLRYLLKVLTDRNAFNNGPIRAHLYGLNPIPKMDMPLINDKYEFYQEKMLINEALINARKKITEFKIEPAVTVAPIQGDNYFNDRKGVNIVGNFMR